ncbi:MAG: type I methionyl aminopeptidase [Patescibacteria group bacterium]|nr:type I methionyl aminopeptidase [Patescibacteria group bacterium]
MIAKTDDEIKNLREAGKKMAEVVRAVLAKVGPDVSSWVLEEVARAATARLGARPSYLNYSEGKKMQKYPAALCVSINNEIAHSPPRPDKMLRAGDVVSIDFGLEYNGIYMDTACTVGVGAIDKSAQNLLAGTSVALGAAIAAAKVGGYTGDIGEAVERTAKQFKLGVVEELRGHGVGAAVHELPYVDNYGHAGEGGKLVEGMVLALEPIFAERSGDMVDAGDGYTYITKDGSRSAHFEHTVLLTQNGPEILTA